MPDTVDARRYDYDPKQGILVSRMPTQLHSIFISSVVTEIRRRLDSIAENGDTISKAFSREIVPMASARIDLLGLEEEDGKQKIRHDPDFSFQHLEAQWAGVVLELSYPEKRRALPHLADDYILGSGGNVRILVALDLDTNTKAVTISTWRPILVKGNQEEAIHLEVALTIDREVFRDEFGNPNPDPNAGLRLNLEDFGPQCLTEGLPAETSVFIDAATLSRTLTRAEHESMVKEDCGSQIRKPNTQ